MLREQLGHRAADRDLRRERAGAHHQLARFEARELRELAPQRDLVREQRRAALEQQATEGRGLDAAASAVEETNAERVLEPGDAARERGLRDVQRLRRARVAAVMRQRDRVLEEAEVERHARTVSDGFGTFIGRARGSTTSSSRGNGGDRGASPEPSRPLSVGSAQGLLGCALVACSDGGGAAPASDASDPVQALLALARDSDPDARNLAISLCVISAMEAQHGAAAANLVVAATAAQARGERPSADTVPVLTAMLPIALECTRDYELRASEGRSERPEASLH